MKTANNTLMKYFAAVLVMGVGFATGCFDFEANHMVTKFKVLAVQAEPAEIAPGDGFEMEVLYADPKGKGREVSFAWMMCVNAASPVMPVRPEMGPGACSLIQTPVVETASNDGHIFTVDETPQNIMDYYPTELLNPSGDVPVDAQIIYVTAVVIACAGGELPGPAQLEDSFLRVSDLSTLCRGGDGITTYKALRVTPPENTAPNENPVISKLSVNKESVALQSQTGDTAAPPLAYTCESTEKCKIKLDIAVNLTPASEQRYSVKAAEGYKSIAETLYVTWFTTGGEYEKDRTIADAPVGPYDVEWTVKKPGLYTLWAVAHDTRGGISWESFRVHVATP